MSEKKATYHHGNLPEHIVRVAWQNVRQKGADALSLRSCARDVGVDPAAVYRHFKSKEALLAHLANKAFVELSDAMEAAEAEYQHTNPREALVQIGVAYIQYATTNPHVFQMMFDVTGRSKGASIPEISEEGRGAYDILVRAILRVNPRIAVDVSVLTLWSVVHGFAKLTNAGLGPNPEQTDQMSRAVCESAASSIA